MAHKVLPLPIAAIVCKECKYLYTTITDFEPLMITPDIPFKPSNPLVICSTCSGKLSVVRKDFDLSEYRYKGGKRGY